MAALVSLAALALGALSSASVAQAVDLAESFPVGTIRNGTCGAVYVAGDPATDAVGYFEPVPTLAACVAKVKSSCPLANYVSWSSKDHSCAWYNKCDMATLCVDCSAAGSCANPPNPQCPVCSGPCPFLDPPYPHTSEVIRTIAPPPPPPTPFPVGSIGNGTCGAGIHLPNNCSTDYVGYFEGVPTLAACATKAKSCPLANYVSWSSKDHSCAWYYECDMATLCADCSAAGSCANPPNPQCPQCSHSCPDGPYPHTSEVIKKVTAEVIKKVAAKRHRSPAVELESGAVLNDVIAPAAPLNNGGCFMSPPGTTYKFAPGRLFPKAPCDGGCFGPTMDSSAKCCAKCESFKNCSFFTYSAGGTADKPVCYGKPGGCCFLNTAAAATGKSGGCAACSAGSTQALAKPCQTTATCCKDGTSCGGTNLWTSWINSALPNASSANPGTMPYPKSKDLTGWLFKSGCNPGYGAGAGAPTGSSADTFYPSWAADGNLYTPFTDGSVVDDVTGKAYRASSEGGGPGGGHVTHGQAAIVGDDPFGLTIEKVAQFVGSSGWPYVGRFPCGSLVYKGTWWYGTYYVPTYPTGPSNGPGNVLTGGLLGPLVDFRHTTEFSPANPANASWVEPRMNATSAADNLFGEIGQLPKMNGGPKRIKFGTPHWVDFGQELEHSPDGKAYIVGHGATSPSSTEMWMLGDQVYMARVLPTVADIDDKSKWEFYAGGHGASAKWVTGAAGVAAAAPLVEFTNHTGSTTVTYFAGIKKYIMTICTASTYNSGPGHDAPVMDGGNFDTYFLESDDITGPWSYVTYLSNFGPQVYFANHPSKFAAKAADTSAKTFDTFLMFSANYDAGSRRGQALPNSAYHMNLQQSRFTLSAAFSDKLETRYKEEKRQAANGLALSVKARDSRFLLLTPGYPLPNATCQAKMDAYCNRGNNGPSGNLNGSCPIVGPPRGCTAPLYAVNSTGNGHGPGRPHAYRCFSGASLNANHTAYNGKLACYCSGTTSEIVAILTECMGAV